MTAIASLPPRPRMLPAQTTLSFREMAARINWTNSPTFTDVLGDEGGADNEIDAIFESLDRPATAVKPGADPRAFAQRLPQMTFRELAAAFNWTNQARTEDGAPVRRAPKSASGEGLSVAGLLSDFAW